MSTDPNTRSRACREEHKAERASRLCDRKANMQRVWDLAAEGRRTVPAGTNSAHDDLYDEHGLPQ
jgi:hypothetical protein